MTHAERLRNLSVFLKAALASVPEFDFANVQLKEIDVAALLAGAEALEALQWRPISEAPKSKSDDFSDRVYIELRGDSGMCGFPDRVSIGYWHSPSQRWLDEQNEPFIDGGTAPTHWRPFMPLPEPPKGDK